MKPVSYHAGHAGKRRAAGMLVQSVDNPLDPRLQVRFMNPGCLLAFDTKSSTNEVALQHYTWPDSKRPVPCRAESGCPSAHHDCVTPPVIQRPVRCECACPNQ